MADPNKLPPSQAQAGRNSLSSQRNSHSGSLNRSPSSSEFVNFMGNPVGGAPNGPPANPPANNEAAPVTNRLETIRLYYSQLTNNIRLIQQQLQQPDLPPPRRQALLMEQARANAAMQHFTEKVLKPISAAQKAAGAQMPPNTNSMQSMSQPQQPGYPQNSSANFRPTAYNRYPPQTSQYPHPQQQTHHQMMRPPLSSAQKPLPPGQTIPRPPVPANINLNSQVNMGMIRPIMNAPVSSIPPSPNRYRPPLTQQQIPSAAQPYIPPPTTPTKAQQTVINRQSYLAAAQQHQNTVRQQQNAFNQRLVIFAREAQTARKAKQRSKAPILALPTPNSIIKSATGTATSNSQSPTPLRVAKAGFYASSLLATTSGKTSSLPSMHGSCHLNQLARQVNPRIQLDSSAQKRLLGIADILTEQLIQQACQLAGHRNSKQLSVEDVQLALDLTLNYQPAGQGSIEHCRPPKKPATVSSGSTETSSNAASASLAHHHRMAVIRKHASIYQSHLGRITEQEM